MTMTEPLIHRPDGLWTIDDLEQLPDLGMRYELVDGSLLVSPPAFMPHTRAANRLRRQLERQAPAHVEITTEPGVSIAAGHTYFVPDLVVTTFAAVDATKRYLHPRDISLVVEVLSTSNAGTDTVTKRHYYASVGIPAYWIVDQEVRAVTILRLDHDHYIDEAIVRAGEPWTTDHPFPLTLDPAEFC